VHLIVRRARGLQGLKYRVLAVLFMSQLKPQYQATEKAGRDSSTSQADSFAGAKEEEKASACSARNDRWVLWRDERRKNMGEEFQGL
jgi:hypothetical protein